MRLRLGVVGVGHLGQAHARILAGLPEVKLVGVVDTNPAQAQTVADRHHTRVFADHRELAGHVDAACVVVPTTGHHAVACDFLSRGIPVLVEKPLTPTVEQANQLVELSHRNSTILQVGHIERFNPAFEELRKRPIHPKFIECERHGTFTGRSTDIGAVLDLMIHDLDLLLDLVASPVVDVSAVGAAVFGGHEDMVNARLRFASGCVAHLTASRMSPNAKRKLRIWAGEGYAGIDFVSRRLTLVQPSDELRHRCQDFTSFDPSRREALQDQVFTRYLQTLNLDCNHGDQLMAELEHFIHCVRTKSRPRVAGEDGRDAVVLAARVLESMRRHKWENRDGGPTGPHELPRPAGWLFGVNDAA
ncbi:MAG: Gfo/Idh/MocA family oxidoreductase [Gemmataceae bacterium]